MTDQIEEVDALRNGAVWKPDSRTGIDTGLLIPVQKSSTSSGAAPGGASTNGNDGNSDTGSGGDGSKTDSASNAGSGTSSDALLPTSTALLDINPSGSGAVALTNGAYLNLGPQMGKAQLPKPSVTSRSMHVRAFIYFIMSYDVSWR